MHIKVEVHVLCGQQRLAIYVLDRKLPLASKIADQGQERTWTEDLVQHQTIQQDLKVTWELRRGNMPEIQRNSINQFVGKILK